MLETFIFKEWYTLLFKNFNNDSFEYNKYFYSINESIATIDVPISPALLFGCDPVHKVHFPPTAEVLASVQLHQKNLVGSDRSKHLQNSCRTN